MIGKVGLCDRPQKKFSTFGTNNFSQVRTYAVVNALSRECNFWIKILQNTFLKRLCIKLQHASGPDQTDLGKSYTYLYRVMKTINVSFLYFYILLFLLVFRFDWKIFCVVLQSACVARKRRGKARRQICYVSCYECVLNIMIFSKKDTFKHCNYPGEMHK